MSPASCSAQKQGQNEGEVENQRGLNWKEFSLIVGRSRELAPTGRLPSVLGTRAWLMAGARSEWPVLVTVSLSHQQVEIIIGCTPAYLYTT